MDWGLDEIFTAKAPVSLCKVFRDEVFNFITISRNLCLKRNERILGLI